MNFGLLAEAEQDAVIYTYASLLNSLNYPIQIVIQSQTKDVTDYLNLLKQQETEVSTDQKRDRIARYRQFVSDLIKERNVLDKKFYVVGSATPGELGLITADSVIPGKTEFDITKFEKSVILEKTESVLDPRRDHLISQFARIGLFARQLNTQEIIRIFYTSYNPEASEGLEVADTLQYTTPLVRASLIKQTQQFAPQQQGLNAQPEQEQEIVQQQQVTEEQPLATQENPQVSIQEPQKEASEILDTTTQPQMESAPTEPTNNTPTISNSELPNSDLNNLSQQETHEQLQASVQQPSINHMNTRTNSIYPTPAHALVNNQPSEQPREKTTPNSTSITPSQPQQEEWKAEAQQAQSTPPPQSQAISQPQSSPSNQVSFQENLDEFNPPPVDKNSQRPNSGQSNFQKSTSTNNENRSEDFAVQETPTPTTDQPQDNLIQVVSPHPTEIDDQKKIAEPLTPQETIEEAPEAPTESTNNLINISQVTKQPTAQATKQPTNKEQIPLESLDSQDNEELPTNLPPIAEIK
ncbi:MAG: hypothetical protein XD95_0051 [Microgenomates bacterium 39_7]|nr:MAG: hypothetical protein XD95_0051 [Microgenomates bacterium 39_7]